MPANSPPHTDARTWPRPSVMKSPPRESSRSPGSDAKRTTRGVSAGFAELSQQKHGVQMGHVIALGIELRSPVHCILQDAQKLWRDLFPALHGCFDCCSCKLPGKSFELVSDFGCFHWHSVPPLEASPILLC